MLCWLYYTIMIMCLSHHASFCMVTLRYLVLPVSTVVSTEGRPICVGHMSVCFWSRKHTTFGWKDITLCADIQKCVACIFGLKQKAQKGSRIDYVRGYICQLPQYYRSRSRTELSSLAPRKLLAHTPFSCLTTPPIPISNANHVNVHNVCNPSR